MLLSIHTSKSQKICSSRNYLFGIIRVDMNDFIVWLITWNFAFVENMICWDHNFKMAHSRRRQIMFSTEIVTLLERINFQKWRKDCSCTRENIPKISPLCLRKFSRNIVNAFWSTSQSSLSGYKGERMWNPTFSGSRSWKKEVENIRSISPQVGGHYHFLFLRPVPSSNFGWGGPTREKKTAKKAGPVIRGRAGLRL